MATSEKPSKKERDPSKVHKLSLKGSARLVAEFVRSALSPPCTPVEAPPSRWRRIMCPGEPGSEYTRGIKID